LVQDLKKGQPEVNA